MTRHILNVHLLPQFFLFCRAPNNDYSSNNLQTVNDSVYINLFDEFVTDVLQDDRQRGREVHKRLDKKWLGGIQIPFATLYANGVVSTYTKLGVEPD